MYQHFAAKLKGKSQEFQAMTNQSNVPVSATIAAANVSGQLYRAGEIAKNLSLAAKNSRAMVMRAGSRAAGLQVISDFFAELASNTIQLSGEINQCAISISNNSVTQWRTHTLTHHLNQAGIKDENPELKELVNTKVTQSEDRLEHLIAQFSSNIKQLDSYLERIEEQIRASSVIAVNFRLEATQTGEFQPMLNHMADNIDFLSNKIKEHVSASQHYMKELRGR